MSGKKTLKANRDDDPGTANLGLNIRMGDENFSIAQKEK
jgi:hypothetical protein